VAPASSTLIAVTADEL
jgi:hypothetical protein